MGFRNNRLFFFGCNIKCLSGLIFCLGVSAGTFLIADSAVLAAGEPADDLSKGMQLTKQGKYRDAVLLLQRAPDSATKYYYQGVCYYQLHHNTDAKQLFFAVTERYPNTVEARMAVNMLRKVDPGFVPMSSPAPTRSMPEASISKPAQQSHMYKVPESSERAAAAVSPDAPSDLEKLPEQARIFYTPAPSGHMIVDASINGHPYKCMFDTGAPGLLFGKNTLRTMGIPVPQGPATTSVSGWAGVRLPAWEMNLTVKVGGLERTLSATVQEELNIPPLIGYSFVQGYQYEIDDKAKCMMLKKEGNNQQTLNNLYDVPCQVVGTKPIVAADINGRRASAFFIDTGAANTIINPATAAALGVEIPADAQVTYAGGVGGSSAYRIVPVDLRLGPVIRKEFQVLIGGHAGNAIGQDFLQGWRFTIDEKKGFVRFFH